MKSYSWTANSRIRRPSPGFKTQQTTVVKHVGDGTDRPDVRVYSTQVFRSTLE
jgi:hypothetical protein